MNNYNNNNNNNSSSVSYTITLDNGYNLCTTKVVKAGQSVTLPTMTRSGYKFTGWDIPSLGLCTNGAYTYKPTKSETVTAMWVKATSSSVSKTPLVSTSPFNTNYNKTLLPNAFGRAYATGGMSYETGPAWLDGTPSKPEAVLNALQTEHFIKFTNALDNIFGGGNMTNTSSSVNIENISFNVESMSSTEDGEKAFNAFVNKFKEIGSQTGIKINSFKNTL